LQKKFSASDIWPHKRGGLWWRGYCKPFHG